MNVRSVVIRRLGRTMVLTLILLACAWHGAAAQTNTARVTGTVTGSDGAPVPNATVTARSLATNFERSALTSDRGFYNILGLPPDVYEITVKRIGLEPQTRRIRAQIGQTLRVDFQPSAAAVQLATVEVVGQPVAETRTTEQATNITQEQIRSLPQGNRNFLDFATLAPGVVPTRDGTSLTSGALSANNINVFIDGASYKNDVLNGGVAGQDASIGNPFPQTAIKEFRVISQLYKAEYQKATSAIITATTKSGTNTWTGDAFVFDQREDFIARNFFQRQDTSFQAVDMSKYQFGGSFGGPIIHDKLFIFGAYEGNHQNQGVNVLRPNLTGAPANVAQDLAGVGGSFTRPLRSDLYFGKLTYQPAERHRLELSTSIRKEYEIRNFGGGTSRQQAEDFNNNVYTGVLDYQYTRGNILNEAHLDLQRYRWNPIPLTDEVGRIYQNLPNGTFSVGGRSTEQDFIQDRLTLRDHLTYTVPDWFGSHVFKGGGSLTFAKYDVTKFLTGNPQFTFRSDENYAFPFQANMGVGDPHVVNNDRQVGLFVQDDWNVTPRFLLSLGLRWDYESNMLNNDWVTPDSVRAQMAQFLTPAQQANYFTDGNDRSPYLGMFQPRIGFSWQVAETGHTTIFGGYGLFYDRENYNTGLDERYRLQFPTYVFHFSADGAPDPRTGNPTIKWDPSYMTRAGLLAIAQAGTPGGKPEAFVLPNDFKPPKAHQFTAGVRQAFGRYRASLSYVGVRGYNELTFLFGNRKANNACCDETQSFSHLLIGDQSGRSWYNAMYLTLERPYVDEGTWSWGGTIAYTLGKAETNVTGNFTLDVASPAGYERHPTDNDQRHRIVANWIVGLPLDIRFSGIATLGTGLPVNVTVGGNPPAAVCAAQLPGATCSDNFLGDDYPPGVTSRNGWRPSGLAYRNVDIRLEKDFALPSGQQVGVVADVFNLFDHDNFLNYNGSIGNYNAATQQIELQDNYLEPTGVFANSSRRFQLGLRYAF